MQTVQITLQDAQLEQAIMRLAQQRQQNPQEFILAALRHYVFELEQHDKIPKLDPLQHSQAPAMPFQAPKDASDLMFQDIENSAEFAKQLRQQAWRHE